MTTDQSAVPIVEKLLSEQAQSLLHDLTPAQRRSIQILDGRVMWSTGEIPNSNRGEGRVRIVTLRHLKKKGIADTYGVHEWGPHPIWGAGLTDLGRECLRLLNTSKDKP